MKYGHTSIGHSRGTWTPNDVRSARSVHFEDEEEGCLTWIGRKADNFRELMASTFCACFEAIPSIGLMVLAILLLLLLLGFVPLAVMLTYMAPEAQKAPEPDTQFVNMIRPVQGAWPLDDLMDDTILTKSISLVPKNISGCSGFGFACTSHPDIVIGTNQRCDGKFDCPDHSDEHDCRECQTSLSCPSAENSNRRLCLRGSALCDRFPNCADNSDELMYCSSTCQPDEYQCKDKKRCIPLSFKCDGDAHCSDGDDEEGCEECVNGAKMCKPTGQCLPKWLLCNGVQNCPDGSDEMECDCRSCSGSDKALCNGDSKMCIKKSEVCDGITHCQHGEDEMNCPGSCSAQHQFSTILEKKIVRRDIEGSEVEFSGDGSGSGELEEDGQPRFRDGDSFSPEDILGTDNVISIDMIRCNDNKTYNWKYACSGLYPQCNGLCHTCNTEQAFQCADKSNCIHRTYRCDGSEQCPDKSDEQGCDCSKPKMNQCRFKSFAGEAKCYSDEQKCDGFRDCIDGEDEKNCDECKSPAFHCAAEKKCILSTARCDGITHCSDGSDESNCSCNECQSHPFSTYMCERSQRCFRTHQVCNPYTQCPDPTKMDKLYCATRQRPYF